MGGGTTLYGHDLHTIIQMFLDTRNKNMYGLGVGILMGFEIQQISHFWGVGLTRRAISNVLHLLHVTQGTRKYMVLGWGSQ